MIVLARHIGGMNMLIGIPKEIKNNENRVAIVPAGVSELVAVVTKLLLRQMPEQTLGFQMQLMKQQVQKLKRMQKVFGQLKW